MGLCTEPLVRRPLPVTLPRRPVRLRGNCVHNQAAQATGSRRSAMRFRVPARASFWVMIVAYLGLMFAARAPSPLYVVYQARWHFSAITLTSVFGVYALALRSLTPRMGVPRRLRPEFFRTMPALFATWAQVGLTLSLTTTLAAARFGLTDRFLDALVVGVVCGSASVATVVMRNASSRRGTVLGCAALVTGTAITLVSLAGPWTIAFYVGATATGLGLGSAMGAAMRSLSALPAHSERGEFFASVYVVGYLAFSVPAIIAGIAVVHAGIAGTTVGYGLGISLLALVAAVNALRPARDPAPELVPEFAPELASEEASPAPVGASREFFSRV
jgi:hypothetical protein